MSSHGIRVHPPRVGRRCVRVAQSKKDGSPDTEQLLKAGLELAKNVAAADPKVQALTAFAGKYLATDGSAAASAHNGPGVSSAPSPHRAALLSLLLLNAATFILANDVAPDFFASLPLNHARPCWWQFLTSCFVTTSWLQLSALAFTVVAFGSQVAARQGAAGLWLAYTAGAVGANLAWFWLLPERVGRAALLTHSSALGAFALFLTCGLQLRVGGFWWSLLDVALLGQFLVWLLLSQPPLAALPPATLLGHKLAGGLVGLAGCTVGVGLFFGAKHAFTRFAAWIKKHHK